MLMLHFDLNLYYLKNNIFFISFIYLPWTQFAIQSLHPSLYSAANQQRNRFYQYQMVKATPGISFGLEHLVSLIQQSQF